MSEKFIGTLTLGNTGFTYSILSQIPSLSNFTFFSDRFIVGQTLSYGSKLLTSSSGPGFYHIGIPNLMGSPLSHYFQHTFGIILVGYIQDTCLFLHTSLLQGNYICQLVQPELYPILRPRCEISQVYIYIHTEIYI